MAVWKEAKSSVPQSLNSSILFKSPTIALVSLCLTVQRSNVSQPAIAELISRSLCTAALGSNPWAVLLPWPLQLLLQLNVTSGVCAGLCKSWEAGESAGTNKQKWLRRRSIACVDWWIRIGWRSKFGVAGPKSWLYFMTLLDLSGAC